MEKKIKLLICYHKPDVVLKDDVMVPIHVGRAPSKTANNSNLKWMMDNMIGDDTGENISAKNASYNELTALYWAWKNYDSLCNPDYLGLMHYRRHFIFEERDDVSVVDFDNMEGNYLESIKYSESNLQKLFQDCDFVYHKGIVDNIYKHYAENHRIEDLDRALTILKDKYPSYAKAADHYIQQGYGCFCNMFIFPKKMFFDYCEWLFSILAEFEKQVDMSEKRFFVSERLTGIFIEKKMLEGMRAKTLPTSFLKAPCKIPIALPLDINNSFPVACTMNSMLVNAKKNTEFTFYLLCNKDITEEEEKQFDGFKEHYSNCKIVFINAVKYIEENSIKATQLRLPEHYPLLLAELLPDVGKCLYVTPKILALKDLEEFYRTCSVDDYWIVGLPTTTNNPFETHKALKDAIYMMNLSKIRKHKIVEELLSITNTTTSTQEIINGICVKQIGYFPPWFYTLSKNTNKCDIYPENGVSRAKLQEAALWKAIICYDGIFEPYIDMQGVYSIFWWNIAAKVPSGIPFVKVNYQQADMVISYQQMQLNAYSENKYNLRDNKEKRTKKERLEGVFAKTKAYYKKHGLVNTIKKIRSKI